MRTLICPQNWSTFYKQNQVLDGAFSGCVSPVCKSKNNLKVEFALKDINKPIGVSGYLTKALEFLPKKLQSSLPTIENIEAELMPKLKRS